MANTAKRILVAPLDWGMGHATRCIPLIRQLQEQGAKVLVACPPELEARMRLSLSDVDFVPISGYDIRYHRGLPVWLSVLLQLHKLRRAIRQEHRWLLKQAELLDVQQIISDNRYGLWHPQIHSILLTHQLQPQVPMGGNIARTLMRSVMRRLLRPFQEIWVPDEAAPERLSGQLSEPFGGIPPLRYIGRLSRFQAPSSTQRQAGTLLTILSGPEPHYSRFYHRAKEMAQREGLDFRALGWKMPEGADPLDTQLNLSDDDFALEVCSAEKVLCSAGYSSLCDLLSLGRPEALVFPTPGQTEQAYLASRWKRFRTVVPQKRPS